MRLVPAVIIVAAIAFAACDSTDDHATTPSPQPTTTGAATPSPTELSDPDSLRLEAPIDLPENLALTIITGCWQCDGPPSGIVRVRRVGDTYETRTLFSEVNINPGATITGVAFSADGLGAALSVCRSDCGDLSSAGSNASSYIPRSSDGGMNFTVDHDEFFNKGYFAVVGYLGDEAVIVGPFTQISSDTPIVLKNHQQIPRPPGTADYPYPTPKEILFASTDHKSLLDASGNVLHAFDGEIASVTALYPGDKMAIITAPPDSTSGEGYDVTLATRTTSGLSIEKTWHYQPGFIMLGPVFDECHLAGNVSVPPYTVPVPGGRPFVNFLPALINICDGVVQPIAGPFVTGDLANGRNIVAAARVGPFISVGDHAGSCLNVRTAPTGDAQSLGCFVAGTLLHDLGDSRPGGTQTWRHVVTPSGKEGWASEEFLAP